MFPSSSCLSNALLLLLPLDEFQQRDVFLAAGSVPSSPTLSVTMWILTNVQMPAESDRQAKRKPFSLPAVGAVKRQGRPAPALSQIGKQAAFLPKHAASRHPSL